MPAASQPRLFPPIPLPTQRDPGAALPAPAFERGRVGIAARMNWTWNARGVAARAGLDRTPDDTPVTRIEPGGSALWARPGQPRTNGSRVPPLSSTQTDLFSVYSSTAAAPFSRPSPDSP
jgi:hypothetical protein